MGMEGDAIASAPMLDHEVVAIRRRARPGYDLRAVSNKRLIQVGPPRAAHPVREDARNVHGSTGFCAGLVVFYSCAEASAVQ